MAGFKTEWNIGDICVMVASGPKRYTQEFKVQSFDGKYYTVRRGDDLYHVSPSRMFQTKEEADAFIAPAWFGPDVTFSGEYQNSRLSAV